MTPAPHLLSAQRWRGLRIGLLGGSFNPAHAGHLHISLLALNTMKVDFVWWLVSPQNPLKSSKGMATFKERLASAAQISFTHPRIIVSDLEAQLGTRFTADTMAKLRARFPFTRFIWMMGADNLLQIPRWQRWAEIFKTCDVAVFRRPPYFVGASQGLAATRFSKQRRTSSKAKLLGYDDKKQWVLFNNRLHGASSTRIRESMKKR